MSPPGNAENRRPARDTGSREMTQAAADLKPTSTLRHGSDFCRWRHFDKNRRRRAAADAPLLPRWQPPIPQTFGLEDGELRRHANSLVRDYGWSVDEVMAVLDVQLRAM